MNFIEERNEFLNETLYKADHKSGLKVVVLKKLNYDKFYAVLSTKFGSNNIEFKINDEFVTVPDGIAHFLEHKMFEQPDGTNAFDKFSYYGANANAYTSFNNTSYLFQSTSEFYNSLDHLLNYVFSPCFTDENVSKEQGIIAQEIRMYDDDPEWRVFFNMLKGMYINHPIKRDIAGTVESISQINKDLLYLCYNNFYHPQNMVLFLAGNIDLKKLDKIIDDNVKKRDYDFNVVLKEFTEPDRINEHEITQNLSVSIPMFSCGYKDKCMGETGIELAKKNLLTSIIVKLFIGESSMLYEKLYNNGLINDSFYDDITMGIDYSFIQFVGESKNPIKVKEMILDEVKRIKNEGFPKEDFERIKKFYYGKYLKSFNNIESVGNSFCGNYFLRIDLFDFLDVYDKINYDDAITRFNNLFNEDMFVMSIVYPNDK